MTDYCACFTVYLPEVVDYVTVDNYEHTRSQCSDLLTGKVLAPTGERR